MLETFTPAVCGSRLRQRLAIALFALAALVASAVLGATLGFFGSLVGTRPALIAAAASARISDVKRLVLWDPTTSGRAYLEALSRLPAAIVARGGGAGDAGRGVECAGHWISTEMCNEISALNATDIRRTPANRLRIVTTSEAVDADLAQLPVETVRFDCNWDTDAEDLMMPQPVLERLVTAVAAE